MIDIVWFFVEFVIRFIGFFIWFLVVATPGFIILYAIGWVLEVINSIRAHRTSQNASPVAPDYRAEMDSLSDSYVESVIRTLSKR